MRSDIVYNANTACAMIDVNSVFIYVVVDIGDAFATTKTQAADFRITS